MPSKIAHLKNPTFIANIKDPKTNKYVKKIYQVKTSKIGRTIEPLVWEYYKNRGTMSVEDTYKKYKGFTLKMIYFDDPLIYEIVND